MISSDEFEIELKEETIRKLNAEFGDPSQTFINETKVKIPQKMAKEIYIAWRNNHTEKSITPPNRTAAFSTARGQSVHISAAQLKRSADLFAGINDDLIDKYSNIKKIFNPTAAHQAGPSGLGGFSTARGSNIEISATKLEMYAETLKEIDRNVRAEFENKSTGKEGENLVRKITAASEPQRTKSIDEKSDNLYSFLNENNDIFDNLDLDPPERIHHKVKDDMTIGGESMKRGRENALNKQQADCFNKPQPIRPVSGSLYNQKLLLTSTKLHELGHPKKYQRNELERLGIAANIIDLNVDNALQFKFDMWKFYPEDDCRTNVDGIDILDGMRLIMDGNSRVGIKELTSAFLNCPPVDPKLVPDHWIKNALKWILVKLASYERSYPHRFAGTCLTPENVLVQLKYRYDREIDKVNRSAIRKIVERDDAAAKRMVLFVSGILNNNLTITLELSDGWYGIKTSILDAVLTKAVVNGKITIGTKLVVQGAEIAGIEEACSPLEMPGSVALKISANSARRARWYAKLGFCKESWPFAISLNSVNENGGVITRMKAYVLRVYPTVFVVKHKINDNYETVLRSDKEEKREKKRDVDIQQQLYEKLYGEASVEVDKVYEKKRMKTKVKIKQKISEIEDGELLWNIVNESSEDEQINLTPYQQRMIENYKHKYEENRRQKIQAKIEDGLKNINNATTTTPLLKVRLIDAVNPCATKTSILWMWNISESYATLRENSFLDLQNITVKKRIGSCIELTANNKSRLKDMQSAVKPEHLTYARKLTPIANIDPAHCFHPHFNEFDTLGFVLKIEDVTPNYAFQSVFIADASRHVLCIQFWGSIEKYAYDGIVQVHKYLVIDNLEWRPHNRYNRQGVVHAFVTQTTTFSENPKSVERLSALADLQEKIEQMDMHAFFEGCYKKLGEAAAQANMEKSAANISSKIAINQTISNQSTTITTHTFHSSQQHQEQEKKEEEQQFQTRRLRRSYINKNRTPKKERSK